MSQAQIEVHNGYGNQLEGKGGGLCGNLRRRRGGYSSALFADVVSDHRYNF